MIVLAIVAIVAIVATLVVVGMIWLISVSLYEVVETSLHFLVPAVLILTGLASGAIFGLVWFWMYVLGAFS